MNKHVNIIVIILLFFTTFVKAQGNIRLAKEIYKGNDFSQTIEYSYNTDGKIKKIVLFQDGKLHRTTSDFVFSTNGLLVSYINTFNLKISPQKTTFTYNKSNKLKTFETKNTTNNKVLKKRAYTYHGDTVNVIEPDNLSSNTIYIYDNDSNIIKMQGLGEPSTAFTNLYNKYDNTKNPKLLTGGYIEDKPLSLHNSLEDNYVDIYVINRKIEYEKLIASQHKPGGAKIPTQFSNGLPLKISETSFDKAYNKVMPVSTATYQYIKL